MLPLDLPGHYQKTQLRNKQIKGTHSWEWNTELRRPLQVSSPPFIAWVSLLNHWPLVLDWVPTLSLSQEDRLQVTALQTQCWFFLLPNPILQLGVCVAGGGGGGVGGGGLH